MKVPFRAHIKRKKSENEYEGTLTVKNETYEYEFRIYVPMSEFNPNTERNIYQAQVQLKRPNGHYVGLNPFQQDAFIQLLGNCIVRYCEILRARTPQALDKKIEVFGRSINLTPEGDINGDFEDADEDNFLQQLVDNLP